MIDGSLQLPECPLEIAKICFTPRIGSNATTTRASNGGRHNDACVPPAALRCRQASQVIVDVGIRKESYLVCHLQVD
jgi:hypothetical protein